ncbi:hypothetical protein M407DRAFT_23215 [Tulasnella calospora MUT 4182]|uniref:Uncharacterized protein n=1 Tax=Tulasnella calospora MUT 4182 TaxID=1051891 RepID=A0A0C3QJY2_9AGAM|nr:hypothetical protein M407DRAFT_23215 [Tulasnella calospora MUT 4182]
MSHIPSTPDHRTDQASRFPIQWYCLVHPRIDMTDPPDPALNPALGKTWRSGDYQTIYSLSSRVQLTMDNKPEISVNVIRRIVQYRDDASTPLHSVTLRGFDSARVSWEDVELIRSSGIVNLTVTMFAEDEAVQGEKDGDWIRSWSSDEEAKRLRVRKVTACREMNQSSLGDRYAPSLMFLLSASQYFRVKRTVKTAGTLDAENMVHAPGGYVLPNGGLPGHV